MIDHTVGLVGNGCGIYLVVGNQKSYSWLNVVGWIIVDWPKLNNYGWWLMLVDVDSCWLLDAVHPMIIPHSPDKQFWSVLYVLPWYLPIWEARLACFGLGAEVQGQSNNAWLAIKIYLVHPKSASKFEFLFPKDTQSDSKYHSTLFCRFHCSAQELVVRHTFMYGFAGLSFKFSWMPNKVTLTTFQAKVTNKI